MKTSLYRELEAQSDGLKQLSELGDVPRDTAKEIAEELRCLVSVAYDLEQLLEVYRLLASGRAGKRMVGDLAASTVLPPAQEGNIVRPDFGRRP